MRNASAVIDDASAASNLSEESGAHADVMPTSKDYMLTGKFPAETETPKEPGNAGDDRTQHTPETPGDDKTAAGSEPAMHTQPEKPSATRTDNRYQKLSRENRELREKLARLEGKDEGRRETQPQQRDDRQSSQPGAEPKKDARPKIDDVDSKTGKPKYATYAEYEEARDRWLIEEGRRGAREEVQKSTQDRTLAEHERVINEETNRRAAEAKKSYADYEPLVNDLIGRKDAHGQDEFFYTKGSHLDGYFLDSDRGHDVIYQLAKNWDKHKTIFARDEKGRYLMNPVRQVRELTKIELALPAKGKSAAAGSSSSSGSSTSSAGKPVSQAPRPPHQTSGTGAATKEAREQAIDDQDQETYRRAANDNDPRLKAYRANKK